MDKPSEKIESFTRKLVKEAGVSKPSIDFKSRVMEAVIQQSQIQKVYQPLLSKQVLGLFVVVIVVGVAVLYFMTFENSTLLERLDLGRNLNISIPEMKTSKMLTYAVGCFALFLVQIPFLKKYLEKQHR
ncbi:hypothetical protein ATE92_0283 [Ulvibacter sp. MAR_2010_11]|uniref:hypothetical protein n=1 Tax=Ulvibacter sp. MAR_2010_11 TaxID=1250229 RepID=UPI000C2BF689|nr:hypothetical protein [Ulvibacter sp. MAR_2010_11]PKA82158.1 hypothetical protein ATE92_0283 [Ulvibacter sp. MAR_2010_11]